MVSSVFISGFNLLANISSNISLCLSTFQDDFKLWEGEVSGKPKERHLFLFKDKLMITRKKKPKKPGEPVTYEFKMLIDVSRIMCTQP